MYSESAETALLAFVCRSVGSGAVPVDAGRQQLALLVMSQQVMAVASSSVDRARAPPVQRLSIRRVPWRCPAIRLCVYVVAAMLTENDRI